MSMKKVSFFIFALTIFLLVIPPTQAAVNYTLLKYEYIKDHPGQAIIPYPWEPITSIRVLPFNYEIPAVPANTFSITACRNEFEPASFIINAQKDLSGITITVPNLYDVQGNTIPSSAIDVRLVKVWYQASEKNIWYTTPGLILTPELLINDDSLVNVDYVSTTNYLKVTLNGVEQYIDISNPAATFPSDAQINDASSLQPFALKANENKQIWLTVHVPNNTPPGDYYGDIKFTARSEVPVIMNFSVRVLPFDLEPAPVEYGLYYTGKLTGPSSYYKTAAQYTLELQDMKDHGVVYPTLYQEDDENLDTALALRDTVGLPKDKIYLLGVNPGQDAYIGNAIDPAGLTTIATKVINWRNHTETYGYTDTYFYGMDEARGDILLSQRPAWQTVHNNGGKIFVAGSGSELLQVVNILDTSVVGQTLNAKQAGLWHDYGHEILSYGNPQVGIENPEIYRNNYGFTLWNAGYDGAMDFAYQYKYGPSIWNDYDIASGTGTRYRDHVFAYPISDGVIDTIQWEGWREGVDDARYVATLIKMEGNITSAKTIVSAGLSNNENMTTIRKKVIEQILTYQVNRAPVLAAIGNKSVYAGSPLTLTVRATDPDGNRLTYSASNLPTDATFTPSTRTFAWTPTASQAGTYNVTFRVTDGSLSDTESVWITAIAKAGQPTPVYLFPESFGTVISEYPAVTVSVVIVALFGLVVYAMRFWRG
jgi:hypothetical protein